MSRVVCAVLALLGLVAVLIVQANLPWADREESGFGATSHATIRTWDLKAEGSAFGFSGSDTKGWYDDGWDDEDKNAVTQLQIAAPLVISSAALFLVGTILSFAMRGPSGPIVTLMGGILAAAGTLLFYLASQDLLDNEATWQAGLWLGVTGAVLGVAGGAFGLASGNMRASAN
jgi:xanthosine utilization system XapX-like protein